MGTIVLTGSTSGSTTLTPTDAVTATLTLPSTTGTILTTANPQSGGVIQVVSTAIQTNFSTTTNGFVSTPITASITPKFSTSKILVQISPVVFITGASTDAGVGFGIVRGATQVYSTSYIAFYAASGATTNAGSVPYIQYLDSPATTSSTTYTLQVTRYTNNGGTTVQINRNYVGTDTSVITLMEIAA